MLWLSFNSFDSKFLDNKKMKKRNEQEEEKGKEKEKKLLLYYGLIMKLHVDYYCLLEYLLVFPKRGFRHIHFLCKFFLS